MVGDVVVDISYGTVGGLCTATFLESMDVHIGRCHLFKRAIILVKAWCYYESRLLGAHHGLVSSYAVETMVLHILHAHPMREPTPLRVRCCGIVPGGGERGMEWVGPGGGERTAERGEGDHVPQRRG